MNRQRTALSAAAWFAALMASGSIVAGQAPNAAAYAARTIRCAADPAQKA